jgi:HAD superfamily hydrolase (TIGR01484 family)
MKWLIAFDLDGTLAESKRPLSEDMAATLARLLAVTDVAVISGGDWPQFEKQVASRLPAAAALDRLWLMPTTGTKLYRFINGAWRAVYAELFDDAEKAKIRTAFDQALTDAGLADERIWGERIEDRGSQITFRGWGRQRR